MDQPVDSLINSIKKSCGCDNQDTPSLDKLLDKFNNMELFYLDILIRKAKQISYRQGLSDARLSSIGESPT